MREPTVMTPGLVGKSVFQMGRPMDMSITPLIKRRPKKKKFTPVTLVPAFDRTPKPKKLSKSKKKKNRRKK